MSKLRTASLIYRIINKLSFLLILCGYAYFYFVKGQDMSNFTVTLMVLWSLSIMMEQKGGQS